MGLLSEVGRGLRRKEEKRMFYALAGSREVQLDA